MTPKRAANVFKLLGDSNRIRLLLALLASEDEGLNVGEIQQSLGTISQPNLSHHLSLCRNLGILEPERSGKNNIYKFADSDEADAIKGMLAYVTEGESPKKTESSPKPKTVKPKASKAKPKVQV